MIYCRENNMREIIHVGACNPCCDIIRFRILLIKTHVSFTFYILSEHAKAFLLVIVFWWSVSFVGGEEAKPVATAPVVEEDDRVCGVRVLEDFLEFIVREARVSYQIACCGL